MARPKRFGPNSQAETLMPGGFIPPEQIKKRGPRRARALCGAGELKQKLLELRG